VSIQSKHISASRLTDLIEGRLTPAAAIEVRTHVASCPRCAREAAWLERVIGLMRTDDNEEPPPRVAGAISRAFHTRRASVPRAARQRFVAGLLFDSARAAMAAARRAGPRAERQMIFQAQAIALDLRFVQSGPQWTVSGQMFGTEPAGEAELRGPADTVRAEVSEMGEFELPPVPPGSYSLMLHLSTIEIEVPMLEIGA
jgi:anti-sigma factor RsiW